MSDPMTPEAKAAVMALMGTSYGEMKKQDDMIVAASGQLNRKAGEMNDMVKQLMNTPTVNAAPKAAWGTPEHGQQQQILPDAAPVAQPAPTAAAPTAVMSPVTPEMAAAELQQAPEPVPVQAPVTPQLEINAFAAVDSQSAPVEQTMEFDFSEPSALDQLLSAVKENTLLLKDIKLQLETSNVRPKRKSAKSKVAG